MVKRRLLFLLFVIFFSLNGIARESTTNVTEKIKSFLDEESYRQNRDFINLIFNPKSDYIINDRVDVVKVIQTLKENGLLKLFFTSPQNFYLTFKTNGAPLFFVRIMDDVLSSIGYFRYVTSSARLNSSEFSWTIELTSEYMTDPLILQKALQKSGCEIIDISRKDAKDWSYTIDMGRGKLNVPLLVAGENFEVRRSLYAHWFNVAKIRQLKIKSARRNHWYPYISYYDASLHLLKLLKLETIHRRVSLDIPKNAKYIKISDLFTLKNLRDGMLLYPLGKR